MKPWVLLYNPPAELEEKRWVRPFPLNVLSICALLDNQKYDFTVVQAFPDVAYNRLLPNIKEAVCLGISCMTGAQIVNGLEVARRIKEQRPDLPIVWGGYHPTAIPEQTLENPCVDIIVRQYGEKTFYELVERLANHRSYEDLEGISFKKGGQIISTQDRAIPILNDLPPMPYYLFDVENFFNETKTRTLHYISSRGCPHQCGFCADFVIYQRRWNALSAERVLNDLESLKKKYNYDSVRFYDSNLFVNEERTRKLCQGVINRGLDFKWLKCNGDAYILSQYKDDTFRLMKEAGITNVLLGMESGYEPALECIGKMASTENNRKAVDSLHRHGISIGFSFMFGFPYDLPPDKMVDEHRKELQATMKTIGELSANYIPGDYYLLFLFTPYPGVRLLSRYRSLGYVQPSSFEDWGRVNLNETLSNPWVSKQLISLFVQCTKINWFFAHKLSRHIIRAGRGSEFIAKFGKKVDEIVCNFFKERIDCGDLSLPGILKVVLFLKIFLKRIE